MDGYSTKEYQYWNWIAFRRGEEIAATNYNRWELGRASGNPQGIRSTAKELVEWFMRQVWPNDSGTEIYFFGYDEKDIP